MRKVSTTPLSYLHCNVHTHRHLRCAAIQEPRESLRRTRDLIIFREIPRKCAMTPMCQVNIRAQPTSADVLTAPPPTNGLTWRLGRATSNP
jgi:hypothetical protein